MATVLKGLDFGRALLEKYGWKDGKGLGRNEDGIVHALKPALKFDNAGVGYSGFSEQFTSQWWERAYNKVAKTIVVVQNESNIKVQQENREELFKTKDARPFSMYNATDYNSFVKTDVLTGEGMIYRVGAETNIEASNSHLTDEEIFQACGGRTVHKGARHGLSLNGKLARIQRQEQELVLKHQSIQSNLCGSDFVEGEKNKNISKKQKRKSILEGTTDGMASQCVQPSEEKKKKKNCPDKLDDNLKSFSKKKKRKESTEANYTKTISAVDEAVNHSYSSETNTDAKINISKKKKKKRKNHEEIEETLGSKVMDILVSEPHKKRRKKKNKENEGTADNSKITASSPSESQKKKEKKKKQENEETSDLEITESLVLEHQKKLKKKRKRKASI